MAHIVAELHVAFAQALEHKVLYLRIAFPRMNTLMRNDLVNVHISEVGRAHPLASNTLGIFDAIAYCLSDKPTAIAFQI